MSADPALLRLIEKLIAIAQTGLAYTEGDYDRERYEQLRGYTAELLAHLGAPSALALSFPTEVGYRTPKVDVRAVIVQEGRVLLTRERSDQRWSLPGGWADVGHSAAKNVEKEVLEETGYQARAVRFLALLDRDLHPHIGGSTWHSYKAFFHCVLEGGAPQTTLETNGVEFFALDALPELSLPRVTEEQVRRLCEMVTSGSTDVWFD